MAKIERAKNAYQGIVFGSILKVYQIIIPFALRTVMINYLGTEYVGLDSLFVSVLRILNIAELGVGVAIVFCMYEPIATDDSKTICALMVLYRKYYRIIGLTIAGIGIIVTPLIPYLIKDDVPEDINVYILYILNLSATVMSYFLFAYRNSILLAHQRVDIISKITLFTSTVQYLFQFAVLIILRNYYAYVVLLLLGQALTNIVTAVISSKLYPEFRPAGKLEKEKVKVINQRIRDLIAIKIGGTITNSADSIVISMFLGLTTLTVFQNYYYIMTAITGFIAVIFGSVTAGIGNSLISESMEKNYIDFTNFTFIVCFILNICCCCFVALYQPFIKLWVGSKFLLGNEYVVLFCTLFYVHELTMIWATIKDAAGIWHTDRLRPLVGSIANLIMNLVLVQYIGLYGVILSTILDYIFISMPWLIHNLFKYIYKKSLYPYLLDVLIYIAVTIFNCIMVSIVCKYVLSTGFTEIILKGVLAVVVATGTQALFFHNKTNFRAMVMLIKGMLKIGG